MLYVYTFSQAQALINLVPHLKKINWERMMQKRVLKWNGSKRKRNQLKIHIMTINFEINDKSRRLYDNFCFIIIV